MKYEIDEKVLLKILNYLASKPYSEVNHLVGAVQECKPIEEEDVSSKSK